MIQIRNVPNELHRRLKARAALAGMSLSDYLLKEIRCAAERPTLEELRAPGAPPRSDALRAPGAGGARGTRQPLIVLDASAVLEVLLRTPAAVPVEKHLFDPEQTLHAPHLMDVEVAQILRRYAASGEADPERCRMALADLMDLPLTRYPHDFLLPRVWEPRNNLTAYDAVHVALAEALDAPLLARDQRLSNAPGHRARIELV